MNIGFFNPYFDSLSGGERYVLTLAGYWSKKHDVSIFWDDPSIINMSEERFNLDLSRVKVERNIFKQKSTLSKLLATRKYDLLFILSDGSIPTSFAKKTILHFQVPFQKVNFPFWKKIHKLSIVCNSLFTKKYLDPTVAIQSEVIYPPVDVHKYTPAKKEKIILSVGRFSSFFQTKKQEVLIEIFKEGVKKGLLKDWKMVLTGGLLESDREYFNKLKESIGGYPIQLLPNISFPALRSLYSTSLIYWHAAGYNETNPQYMEHFGITTVEAMASGCIPIVYNAGGQPEIITHERDGFLWGSKDECLEYTKKIISSPKLTGSMQKNVVQMSNRFSAENFCTQFDTLLATLNR